MDTSNKTRVEQFFTAIKEPNPNRFEPHPSKEEQVKSIREDFFRYLKSRNPKIDAAEWRLRCQRQVSVDNRLLELGPLALICAGNLLTVMEGDKVARFKRVANWRQSFLESNLFGRLSVAARHGFYGTVYTDYHRLQLALQSFGRMICLSVRSLTDLVMLKAYDRFKVWAIDNSLRAGRRKLDETIDYIKYLAKVCQAIFLRTKMPDPKPGPGLEGDILYPFVGELAFVSQMFKLKRTRLLKVQEARACAQMSNTSRALPYPSFEQAKQCVTTTVETFTSHFKPHKRNLKDYRIGLNGILTSSKPKEVSQNTHVSLVGKGCQENGRSGGGRANYLIRAARATTDLGLLEFEKGFRALSGKLDQFGQVILDPITMELALFLVKAGGFARECTFGDVLYVEPDTVVSHLQLALNENRRVPFHLAHILNATASKCMLEVGTYTQTPDIICGFMTFTEEVTYKLNQNLPVNGDLSLESGLKGRLTTSAMAGFAHLSQMPANAMRAFLSSDPFNRVGFEEADKLWSVLKTYDRKVKEENLRESTPEEEKEEEKTSS